MTNNERSIEIKCPTQDCGESKVIQIPNYLFEKKQVGSSKNSNSPRSVLHAPIHYFY